MTPSTIMSINSIFSCISVLTILVDYKVNLKQALIRILGVSLVLILILTSGSPSLKDSSQHELFLLGILIPIYLLFLSLSKVKGFRFAYTFILSLSIMVGINTLTTTLYTVSRHFGFSVLISLGALALCDLGLFQRYRPLYQEVQALKETEWSGFCITPSLSLCLLFLLAEEPLSMIFTLAYLEHELLAYAILFVNHVLIAINLRKFLTLASLKKEATLREKMLEGLRLDLSAQIESVRSMKLLRHDLRHHLQIMALANQGNFGEFEAQVEKLKGKLEETFVVSYCQNFSINAVLSSYFKQAQAENILITHRIALPEKLPIEDIDLSLILANAIENAIHANQKLQEADRYLDVSITHQLSSLTIRIENPVHESIVFKNGLPVSNQIDHGLGTLSISRLAQQAQGQAYFNAQKGRFTLIVQLPL